MAMKEEPQLNGWINRTQMSETAKKLLSNYETPLDVAMALIKGNLSTEEQMVVHEIVSTIVLEAAKANLQLKIFKSHTEKNYDLLREHVNKE